jgi:hypothetical protein
MPPGHLALAGDTETMPDRFHRQRQEDDVTIGSDQVDRNGVKLDRIERDTSDMRVAMTSLAGDVKAMLQRIERHDADHAQAGAEASFTGQDIERRLRALERRSYAIPGLSVILALIGTAVAVYTAVASGHLG